MKSVPVMAYSFAWLEKDSCSQLYSSLLESHDCYLIVQLYLLDTKEHDGSGFVIVVVVRRRIGNDDFLMSPTEMITGFSICLCACFHCLPVLPLYASGRGAKP